MLVALIILTVVLGIIVIFLYRSRQALLRQVQYMAEKVNRIANEDSSEKLLLMTDMKEMQHLLQGINVLLERQQRLGADYRKTEASVRKMLSNISHDLRTPLTVVLGYIESLSLRPDIDDAERSEMLQKVQRKAIELQDIIQKFFDLAKLESGDRDIPLSKVDMNEVCRRTIVSFYDVLTDQGFQVNIDIPEQPIYAHANEEALDRIINNLISNAIRYGHEGRLLELSLRADAESVYVDVKDKGKGIQEIHQDRIFERLYTLEDSRNKLFEGSGLGLTITKRLVEKQNGQISLTSKPYENTTFTVKLKRLSNLDGGS